MSKADKVKIEIEVYEYVRKQAERYFEGTPITLEMAIEQFVVDLSDGVLDAKIQFSPKERPRNWSGMTTTRYGTTIGRESSHSCDVRYSETEMASGPSVRNNSQSSDISHSKSSGGLSD